MIPPTQWDVNQVQSGNGIGWNGYGRSWKRNRNFNQGYVQDTPGYNPNQQGYQNYPNQPTGQPGTFTNPTWNKPARYIPVETPNIPGGEDQKFVLVTVADNQVIWLISVPTNGFGRIMHLFVGIVNNRAIFIKSVMPPSIRTTVIRKFKKKREDYTK